MLPLSTEIEIFPDAEYLAEPVGEGRHKELVADLLPVPLGAERFFLGCDLLWESGEDDEKVLKLRSEASLDGGDTWILLVAFLKYAKIKYRPDGARETVAWMCNDWGDVLTQPENPNCLVRVSFVPIRPVRTRVWGAFTRRPT